MDGTLEPAAAQAVARPRGPRRRYNWSLIARGLADGYSSTEIASVVGCSRQHVWRVLSRSPAVRARADALRAQHDAEAGARLNGLRTLAVEAIQKALERGDARVAVWLADRLGISGTRYPLAGEAPDPRLLADDAAPLDIPETEADFVVEGLPGQETEPSGSTG